MAKDIEKVVEALVALTAHTVGRVESSNIEEFDKGVKVAAEKSAEYFGKIIEPLERELDAVKQERREYHSDLKTLARIIDQYRDLE